MLKKYLLAIAVVSITPVPSVVRAGLAGSGSQPRHSAHESTKAGHETTSSERETRRVRYCTYQGGPKSPLWTCR